MTRRGDAWARWQRIAARAAAAQAHVLFWLLYYIAIVPLGLVRRLAVDPLDRTAHRAPVWRPRHTSATSLDDARRQ